jgi:hypothetical protein
MVRNNSWMGLAWPLISRQVRHGSPERLQRFAAEIIPLVTTRHYVKHRR